MNPLEIVLIILGIIVIVISCILVDRTKNNVNQPAGRAVPLENSITESDKKLLMDKVKELLSEVSEETIVKTDDALSKISNEKIMAVNEFSDQIIEKINRNHEEVVFLYNMLNDKERELKAAVKEIDTSKRKVQDILESKSVETKAQGAKGIKPQSSVKPVTQAAQIEKPTKSENTSDDKNQEHSTLNSLNSNNNTQILSLYSHGKSVIEISKLLGLGQGEVKLVIDLFKGKK